MTQGLPSAPRVQRDDLLEEHRLGVHDVLDGLARHRLGREADEVGGMAGTHRHAELAVGLEAADARPVPGARIDHHERALQRIDRHPGRRLDPHQQVVDRLVERAAVQHQLGVEAAARAAPPWPSARSTASLRWRITSQNRMVRCMASVMYSPTGPQACSGAGPSRQRRRSATPGRPSCRRFAVAPCRVAVLTIVSCSVAGGDDWLHHRLMLQVHIVGRRR